MVSDTVTLRFVMCVMPAHHFQNNSKTPFPDKGKGVFICMREINSIYIYICRRTCQTMPVQHLLYRSLQGLRILNRFRTSSFQI